jgi:hypothetical protein
MATIEELYKAQQSALGVDKIGFEAGVNAKTPHSTNDLKKVDEQVLTADKFKTGRGGTKNFAKYSDSVKTK